VHHPDCVMGDTDRLLYTGCVSTRMNMLNEAQDLAGVGTLDPDSIEPGTSVAIDYRDVDPDDSVVMVRDASTCDELGTVGMCYLDSIAIEDGGTVFGQFMKINSDAKLAWELEARLFQNPFANLELESGSEVFRVTDIVREDQSPVQVGDSCMEAASGVALPEGLGVMLEVDES
jgi:hypothetical protein